MRATAIVISIGAFLLATSVAGAQNLPSGNSGVDQYKESVPGAGGDQTTGPGGSGGAQGGDGSQASGSESAPLSTEANKELEKLGPEGAAAAAAANATAPERTSGGSGGGSESSDDSDEGMGIALPLLLAVALAGAVTVLLMRSRRGTPPGPA